MDQKDLLVHRIVAGRINLYVEYRHKLINLIFSKPTLEQKYRAEEIFFESLSEGLKEGLLSDEDLGVFLAERGLWNKEHQSRYDKVKEDVDDIKIKMFEAIFRSNELSALRDLLLKVKGEFFSLETERNKFNQVSATGYANSVKSRYLIASSLYFKNKPLFRNELTFWACSNNLLDLASAEYLKKRIDETQYRGLARSDIWRSIWNMKRAEGSIFGIPAVEYTDEQRNLVSWTLMYDNVYEHPESPSDDIIEDDDVLDGWLLIQRKKREDEKLKKLGESKLGNQKIAQSDEVYIMADTSKDARAVDAMNDESAKAYKKSKLEYVKKHGKVNEMDMPDVKQRARAEAAKKFQGG